jgi:hypothetical protein
VYGSGVLVMQDRDWHSKIVCASADKVRCASSPAVRPVANIIREPWGPNRIMVRLVQEANINAVFTEKLFQLQLLATNTISFPISQPQVFPSFVL